jgi:formylglycine-generating enzyme required for sulfatase activity
VTQREFEQVLRRNPSYFRPWRTADLTVFDVADSSCYPVEQVAWYDAAEFCNELSRREGLPAHYELSNIIRRGELTVGADVSTPGGPGYRLPSDAEWEYACRAGTTTPFHFGSQLDGRRANVDGNYPYGTREKGPHRQRPEPVGAFPPNAFGLYDMHGNVWEWCNDYYHHRSQPESPQTMDSGDSRVLRGGCWWRDAADARSASRSGHGPAYREYIAGFRVARSL